MLWGKTSRPAPRVSTLVPFIIVVTGYTNSFSRARRECYFTSDSTTKKEKFIRQINYSHCEGGSFNDYQLAEFIQHQRRKTGRLPVKNAVDHVGPQPDGSLVFRPSLFFSSQGMLEKSQYAWIGNLYEGPGIAHHSTACSLQLPLSISPLQDLYTWAKRNMQHNYIPCMLLAGVCSMALHYKRILDIFLFCPIPIANGKTSGTGKTTALAIGLRPTGGYPSQFVSKAMYEKYADMCSSSYLPLVVDDPKSKGAISDPFLMEQQVPP